MGYKLGLPSLKLNNVGFISKNCGCFDKVAREALEERKGKDSDIDRSKTIYNITEGFRTAEQLMAYSAEHIKHLNETSSRAIYKNAVVMCATVIKPPAEMMSQIPIQDHLRLLKDAVEYVKQIVGSENVKAVAYHFDERSPHAHVFWEPMTPDGRLCAKEAHNTKNFFRPLNKGLPEYMRQKGWTMVDDCEAYDAAKEQQLREELGEEEYAKQRAAKKAKNGRDSKTFKYQAEQEKKALEEESKIARAELEQTKQQLAETTKQQRTTQSDVNYLRNRKSELKSDVIDLEIDCIHLADQKETLTDEIRDLETEKQSLRERNEKARQDARKVESRIMQAAIDSIPPRPPEPPPVADWETWQTYNKPQRRNLFDDGSAKVREEWERLQADYNNKMRAVKAWDEQYAPMLTLHNALTTAQVQQIKTRQMLDKEHTRRLQAEQKVHTLSLQHGKLLHKLTGDIPEGQRPADIWYEKKVLGLDDETQERRTKIAEEIEKEIEEEKDNGYVLQERKQNAPSSYRQKQEKRS